MKVLLNFIPIFCVSALGDSASDPSNRPDIILTTAPAVPARPLAEIELLVALSPDHKSLIPAKVLSPLLMLKESVFPQLFAFGQSSADW